MSSIFVFLNFSALVACLASLSLGQSNECKLDQKVRAKYKVVQSYNPRFAPNTRALRLVVKPKNFNRDYMLLLAKTIRRQFCTDVEISALIFDSERAANRMDEGLFLMGKIKVPAVRGLYTLANHGMQESIEYSTQRGNPTNEIRIKLSPAK